MNNEEYDNNWSFLPFRCLTDFFCYCYNKLTNQMNDDTIPLDPFNDEEKNETFDHLTDIEEFYTSKSEDLFKTPDDNTSTLLQG